MRPLELTVEGFRSYRERRHVRLARPAARRDRRPDRLGEVLDPRRGVVRALREDAAGGGRHEVADPPAGRPVARGAPVPGGRAGVAGRAVASAQGRVRTSARAAGRRHARRPGPRGGDARGRDERADRTGPRHGLQDVLSLRPAGAEPVLGVPEGDARTARCGAEGRLRVRAARRRAPRGEDARRADRPGAHVARQGARTDRRGARASRRGAGGGGPIARTTAGAGVGRPRDRAPGEGARCRGGRCRLGDRPHGHARPRSPARFRKEADVECLDRGLARRRRSGRRRGERPSRGGRGARGLRSRARPRRIAPRGPRAVPVVREPGADARTPRRGGRVGAGGGGSCAGGAGGGAGGRGGEARGRRGRRRGARPRRRGARGGLVGGRFTRGPR